MKIKVSVGIIIAIVLGYTVIRYTGHTITKTQSSEQTKLSVQEYYQNKLKAHEHRVWQKLNGIGITKKTCDALRDKYADTQKPVISKKISKKTVALIHDVLKFFNLDPQKIAIVDYQDPSPAATSNSTIYICEPLFNKLSEASQRFVIGHEIHHMMHGDSILCSCFHDLLDDNDPNLSSKNHPFNEHSRFREFRADIETAIASPEYAQGYIEFMKETIKLSGHNPGITHPKHTERLALAEKIYTALA